MHNARTQFLATTIIIFHCEREYVAALTRSPKFREIGFELREDYAGFPALSNRSPHGLHLMTGCATRVDHPPFRIFVGPSLVVEL